MQDQISPSPVYPEELRRAIVSRVLAGESASSIAKDTGIGQPTISRWVREYRASPGGDVRGPDDILQLRQRVKVLESYIARLEKALVARVLENETKDF